MGRPRKLTDGTLQTARAPRKVKLTPFYVRDAVRGLHWDTKQHGLALMVQPTGQRSYKCIYSFRGRARWYHIADANAIGLAEARTLAGKVMYQVAQGQDPQAERKAERTAGTFEQLAQRYVGEYAKKNNKSWKQAAYLV